MIHVRTLQINEMNHLSLGILCQHPKKTKDINIGIINRTFHN